MRFYRKILIILKRNIEQYLAIKKNIYPKYIYKLLKNKECKTRILKFKGQWILFLKFMVWLGFERSEFITCIL